MVVSPPQVPFFLLHCNHSRNKNLAHHYPQLKYQTILSNMISPASKDKDRLQFHTFVQIINGKAKSTQTSRHSLNPANREPKSEVPVTTQQDLDEAVTAAKIAFKTWSCVPYEERKKAVLAYADAIDALRTEFRDLLISEQGKPVCEIRGE